MMGTNPIIGADFPDPDVIRVGGTYYMAGTTMHMMPGCVILRSYDLLHWEVATYVFDSLDDTPAQRLEDGKNIYGKGMWAASLRHHGGKFYVCFIANDTHKTYLYQSDKVEGPWKKQNIEGFYYDNSLLFDDDGRVYIVHGNTEIHLTELKPDLTGPKPGGLNRVIVRDGGKISLGYEGSHFYKINGKYYVFFIHWPATGLRRRTEACFVSDSLEGEFVGKDIFNDDIGFHNQGVAQGGLIDTPDGKWYAMLFQDHGAVGRIPVLVPVSWVNGFPVFGIDGKVPKQIETVSTQPDYRYAPLSDSDDFGYRKDASGKIHLKDCWQWNHTPDDAFWSVTEEPGHYRIRTSRICGDVCQALNTLTQRMVLPSCEAVVTLDGSGMKDGDVAGLCLLQGCYGFIALKKENGKFYLAMTSKEPDDGPSTVPVNEPGVEKARIPVETPIVRLKVYGNFDDMADESEFFYENGEKWEKLGMTHKLSYRLDHFMGCRCGLFCYSTKNAGGTADFSKFRFICPAQPTLQPVE